MAQTSSLILKNKHVLTARCLMLVALLNGEDGPRGLPSHETHSVASERELEISSVAGHPSSLVRDCFSSPRVVVRFCQCAEGLRPQYPNLYQPGSPQM